jgi:hypothetical protein
MSNPCTLPHTSEVLRGVSQPSQHGSNRPSAMQHNADRLVQWLLFARPTASMGREIGRKVTFVGETYASHDPRKIELCRVVQESWRSLHYFMCQGHCRKQHRWCGWPRQRMSSKIRKFPNCRKFSSPSFSLQCSLICHADAQAMGYRCKRLLLLGCISFERNIERKWLVFAPKTPAHEGLR